MNKNAIQKYAIWARNELIEQVKQRAYQYGISAKGYGDENAAVIAGRVLSADEKRQRAAFVREIKRHGFEQAVEDVAYTWFNRFIALRFMEVNDYLPTHVRVFSDPTGGFNPEILKDVLHLDLKGLDKSKVSEFIHDNKTDELYRYILLTQCNALNDSLPKMFEKLGSYTEMLLPNNILKPDGVLGRLVTDIPEEDWRDAVQIIGWLYQYYITDKHDEVVDVRKKSAISKENVPAATQIFTTDWVVKYMVDNSLGKIWVKTHKNSNLISKMDFYIESSEVFGESRPSAEEITFIDPCMGSGHVLVYAFDVLLEMYREEGYSDRESVEKIITKNLYGIDIDNRAYQLASFAIAMKARSIDRRFFSRNIQTNLTHVPESNGIDLSLCQKFLDHEDMLLVRYLYSFFMDAKEYGALLKPMQADYKELCIRLKSFEFSSSPTIDESLFVSEILPQIIEITEAADILSKKYTAVCTNPPYHNKYDKKLEKFIQDNYSEAKADLFAAFILRNLEFCQENGLSGMMTPHGWMFTKSYESVRRVVLNTKSVSTLIHMAKGAFYSEAAVDICSFVLRNHTSESNGKYIRLEQFKGDMELQKEKVLEALRQENCEYVYECNAKNFERIDGIPFSYWVQEQIYLDFEKGEPMKKVSPPRQGMATTNNDRFLRMWFEVPFWKIGFGMKNEDMSAESGKKYFPYNKGGEFRRWYGNNYYVVNFQNHGKELCDYIDVTAAPKFNHKNRVINREFYFRECITWSDISAEFSGRYCPEGFIFDIKGSSGFPPKEKLLYILGLLNSKLTQAFIDILNPTITTQVGDMSRIPIVYGKVEHIEKIVEDCVRIGRKMWDYQEISWDYAKHPLLMNNTLLLNDAFDNFSKDYIEELRKLKENEHELNKAIFEVYGVSELLNIYESSSADIKGLDLKECICELISYAVGCMVGRFSLDVEGLVYAGGDWDASKYSTFPADSDNIIPICDDEYFEDDIAGRFISFIEVVYSRGTLDENLKFIADALGGKGTPREVIRNYFLNDFYKDHCKIYQKRPIYWMFDSGKKNGFKSLVYLHRYKSDLLAKLRTDYVHEQQERYRTQLSHISAALNTVTGSERARLLKQQDKLSEQLKEITSFEEKVHHLADQNITIDLDDGVKKNYEIFTDVLAKI